MAIDPKFSAAYRLLGEILINKKDYEKAIENLKKALHLNKNDSESLSLLGKVIQCSGNSEQAIQYFKESLTQNPTDIFTLISYGNALYETEVCLFIYLLEIQ